MRTLALLLLLSSAAAASFDSRLPALAQDKQDAARRLQKRVEECSKQISERFVFFGGGSGVLIDADGHCLTNHHVAGTMKTTKVQLHSGKQFEAKLVCTDEIGDLALFRIVAAPDEKFPFAELGDSDKLEVGQYVAACGNPFGITLPAEDLKLYPTITLGIVSAVHRNQQNYFDCIQTDAAVNPGNSGGPLVTLDGKVVGINGRIATRYMNRVNSGVGYAIPSNQIKNFLPGMMKGGQSGKIDHGMIGGLQLQDGNTQGQGAKVTAVRAGSTADTAGIRREDLIVEVNGYPVLNRERYLGVIGTYPEKTEVKLKIKRGDETVALKAALDRFNQIEGLGFQMPSRPEPARPKGSGYLGVYVEEDSGAVVVKDVTPDSPADRGGLKAGDAILRVEGRRVQGRIELNTRIWQRKPGDTVKILVRRDGAEQTLEVKLGKHPQDE